MPLQRSEVVDMALKLLDDIGLDALSTRRLAGELDVRPGALYWHVASKQDLLDALTEKILDGLPELPTAPGTSWRDEARGLAGGCATRCSRTATVRGCWPGRCPPAPTGSPSPTG